MAKTINEIAAKVLKKLGRLPEGQTATAAQVDLISGEYDELYQELLTDGEVDWTSTEDLPDRYVHAIYTLLLSRVADDFNVQNIWFPLEQTMKQKIARLVTKKHVYQETNFEDF